MGLKRKTDLSVEYIVCIKNWLVEQTNIHWSAPATTSLQSNWNAIIDRVEILLWMRITLISIDIFEHWLLPFAQLQTDMFPFHSLELVRHYGIQCSGQKYTKQNSFAYMPELSGRFSNNRFPSHSHSLQFHFIRHSIACGMARSSTIDLSRDKSIIPISKSPICVQLQAWIM